MCALKFNSVDRTRSVLSRGAVLRGGAAAPLWLNGSIAFADDEAGNTITTWAGL